MPVVKAVVHALLLSNEAMRAGLTKSVAVHRDLEQAQRGPTNEFLLKQGPVVMGFAREMPVTQADITYDSDSENDQNKKS